MKYIANDHVVVNYTIKFSGTPDKVREWILNDDPKLLSLMHDVLVAETGEYMSIEAYLKRTQPADATTE